MYALLLGTHTPRNGTAKSEGAYSASLVGKAPGLGSSPGGGICCRSQYSWTSLVAQTENNLPAMRRPEFDPWVGKIPWRRDGSPLEYSCLENPHGQSLAGYSPRGPESQTRLRLSTAQGAYIQHKAAIAQYLHLTLVLSF